MISGERASLSWSSFLLVSISIRSVVGNPPPALSGLPITSVAQYRGSSSQSNNPVPALTTKKSFASTQAKVQVTSTPKPEANSHISVSESSTAGINGSVGLVIPVVSAPLKVNSALPKITVAADANQTITSQSTYVHPRKIVGEKASPKFDDTGSSVRGNNSMTPISVQVVTACDRQASVELKGDGIYDAMMSSLRTPNGILAKQTTGIIINAQPSDQLSTGEDPSAGMFKSVWDPVPAGTDSMAFIAKPAVSSDAYYIYESEDKPVFIKFSKYNVVVEIRPDSTIHMTSKP